MASARTPEELLAGVAQRKAEALTELFDRFAPRLLGMLYEMLADREEAEEVLGEVFVRMWNEARHGVATGWSLAAWLFLMARKIGVERLRTARRLPGQGWSHSDPLWKSLSWLPRPEEIARLDERRALLRKVLGQLPGPQRRALELAVFQGYTQTEIAEKLGEPLGQVKSGLRASMRFLRHRLRAVLGSWVVNI